MDRLTLAEKMAACEQAPGYSVLQHCYDVYAHYLAIVDHLSGDPVPAEWKIPSWIHDPLVTKLRLPDEVVHHYLLWHDCGKPFCRVIDDAGRQHFPGHADHSVIAWVEMRVAERMATPGAQWDLDADETQVAKLIKMDMDAHCLTPEQVAEFASRPEAVTLLIAAVAEVHANAAMFGGYESTSFKIKIKHLGRRGRQVLSKIRADRAGGSATFV